jgi:hypothetical protein
MKGQRGEHENYTSAPDTPTRTRRIIIETQQNGVRLPVLKHPFDREPDVFGDLAEQERREVSARVKRYCRAATVGVPEPFV